MNKWIPSRMYGFVRGRQLEGTFPGDPGTGVWPITALRISHGWGDPSEDLWPYIGDASAWPPNEPPGVDAAARKHRIGHYKRLRTISECKNSLAARHPALVSLNISEKWARPVNARIPAPSESDIFLGTHSVSLDEYDATTDEFKFWNSWGEDWGDCGYGYITSEVLEAIWWEGWTFHPDPELPAEATTRRTYPPLRAYAVQDGKSSVLHWLDLIDENDERLAWASALEHNFVLEIEELFVRPPFRGVGLATKLIHTLQMLAKGRHLSLKVWISYSDTSPENLARVEKLLKPIGLRLEPSGLRWAPIVGAEPDSSPSFETLGPPRADSPRLSGAAVKYIADALVLAASSGGGALLYQAIRGWIDVRNGRRIRLKIDDLELETTQLSQDEFLKLLEVVREIQQSDQLKKKLVEAGFSIETFGPGR
jgi:GNAT superfamily N-acetyltransferase